MKAETRASIIAVAFCGLIAVLALAGADLPVIERIGPLAAALLLGLVCRVLFRPPETARARIDFAARNLLRLGIVLLGVRLNFELIAQTGWQILLLDFTVVAVGFSAVICVARCFGLSGALSCLIAVGTSLCGSSAIAATAPAIGARDDEASLAIVLGSLIGTATMLSLSCAQSFLHLHPHGYGLLAGSTLQELAQVMAAVVAEPNSIELGTATKLLRVVLVVPFVFLLAAWARGKASGKAPKGNPALMPRFPKPWFVLGFLVVALLNSLALQLVPDAHLAMLSYDRAVLTIATFLLAMAMAGFGLQVDFSRLRANGRAAIVALIGSIVIFAAAAAELRFMRFF
ncbi:MAG: putative sulfate exporter family transporter [Verrucomicrobiota bacterium]|nr:putative sulfate exporter family transporter [Verrucomicrobiota bacterium]